MNTLNNAYKKLWNLIDRKDIHLKTLDFDSVCKTIRAPRAEMDALLLEELGFDGPSLLLQLRETHLSKM